MTPEEIQKRYESAKETKWEISDTYFQGMWETAMQTVVSFGDELFKCQAELAAAKALLKRVFGEHCYRCHCHSISVLNQDLVCTFNGDEVSGLGRRPDCPYLPWEVK